MTDVVAAWSRSGAEWLTAPGVNVPGRLVRGVADLVASLDAAGAGLASLFGASRHDSDDAATVGCALLAERAAAVGFGPSSRISCGGGTRLLASADGWIAVTLARDDDVDAIPAWLEVDGVTAGDHWMTVADTVATRESSMLVERANLLGIACSAVGEVAPDVDPVIVQRLCDRPATSLEGMVVLDFASLWAGPLAADVLARLGARVITVESEERPDGARATQRFFDSLHGRSESVSLPFRTDPGRRRLAALVERADVVIEGSRPRALAQLGLDAETCVRNGLRLWVSITGHGRDERAADRIGFGDDAAAAGGLLGRAEGMPCFLADAIADPLTGLVTAATIVELATAGGGAVVDVALSRVAASFASRPGDDDPAPSGAPSRPQPRRDAGAPFPLGRDTARVLAEFAIA